MNIYEQFIRVLTEYQFEINSYITSSIKNVNNGDIFTNSLTVLFIAFLYGLIHAAGPGHGKSLVAFYFSTNKHSYSQAFFMGYLISLIHAISALVLTFGIFFLLEKMFSHNFNYYSNMMTHISGIIIIFVGIYIIISSYLIKKQTVIKIEQKRGKFALAFGAGFVPCPGVMTIVLYCIILEKYLLGFFAAIAMSIGMGFTISIVGILAITMNQKTNSLFQNKSFILEIIGGLLILGLGIILLYSS